MALTDTEGRITQNPEATDVKLHVGTGLHYPNKEEITSMYRYPGMKVNEVLNGVSRKYTWNADTEKWISTDDVFTTTTPTTTTIGNLAANSSITNKSIMEILSLMLYNNIITDFSFATSSGGSYINTLTLSWGSSFYSTYKFMKFKVSVPSNYILLYNGTYPIHFQIDGNEDYKLTTNPTIESGYYYGEITSFTAPAIPSNFRKYSSSFTINIYQSAAYSYTKSSKSITVNYRPHIYFLYADDINAFKSGNNLSQTLIEANTSQYYKSSNASSFRNTYSNVAIGSTPKYFWFIIPVISSYYDYTRITIGGNDVAVESPATYNFIYDKEGANDVVLSHKVIRTSNKISDTQTIVVS